MFGFLGEKLIPSISTSLSASYYFHQKNISKKRANVSTLCNYINKKRFVDRFNRQHFDKSGGFYTDKKLNRQTKKCQVNIA